MRTAGRRRRAPWTRVGMLLALGAPGCFELCEPSPVSHATECWIHAGADAGDLTCVGANEHEPNEAATEANLISPPAVCTSRSVSGAVAADVDVFYSWGEPCDDARSWAKLSTDAEGMRLCFFVSCVEGRTALDLTDPCPAGAPFHTVEGLLGCCRTGPGKVDVHINCDAESTLGGRVPELDGYVIVDRESAAGCADYQVQFQL